MFTISMGCSSSVHSSGNQHNSDKAAASAVKEQTKEEEATDDVRETVWQPSELNASYESQGEERDDSVEISKMVKSCSSPSTVSLEDYDIRQVIGTGSFATVHLVRHKGNGRSYALRKVSMAEVISLNQEEEIKRERKVWETMRHPFIVELYGTTRDDTSLYFLLELAHGGDLFTLLRNRTVLTESDARFYIVEISLALQYLHSQDIVYRGLKPEDVLIARDGHVKITDFGFAKRVRARGGYGGVTYTLCGTPDYLAPEQITGLGHGKPADCWALGILVYELLVGYPPFYDEDPHQTYMKAVKAEVCYPTFLSTAAKTFIGKLLQEKASRRLAISEVRRERWFVDIDWDKAFDKQLQPPFVPSVANDGDVSNCAEQVISHDLGTTSACDVNIFADF